MPDLRYAVRQLLKSPGFTAVAIVTLGLAIGVNAMMFTFVRDLVLRPLVREKTDRLVALFTTRAGPRQDFRHFSHEEFSALRTAHDVFADVAATSFDFAAVGRRDELKRSLICFVSDNYFSVLRVRPAAGRFFSAAETRPGANVAVVVANQAFWRRTGRSPDFVGSQIYVNNHPFTVIGIAPAGFGGLHASIGPDVWIPLGAMALVSPRADDLQSPLTHELGLFASLQPGLDRTSATARLGPLERQLDALAPSADPRHLVLTPPPRFSLGGSWPQDESFLLPFAGLAMGLAGAVLLIACLNLANLLFVRGAARRKEIAIRLSLGATSWRIVRQLLVEGLLLALAGGAAGLLLCLWSSDFLRTTIAPFTTGGKFVLTAHPAVDVPVVALTLLLSIVATLLFSLVPALRATRVDLVNDLKQQPGQPGASGRWNRFFSLGHCLVMAQIALSLMLLFSAGLFLRASHEASHRDPGFQTAGQLVANLDYGFASLRTGEIVARQHTLLDRVAALPGVKRAALASVVPFNFELPYRRVFPAGASAAARSKDGAPAVNRIGAGSTTVSRGYFTTLGIPLLRGRDFTAAETARGADEHTAPVAIIDETLARALFGDGDALGRHFILQPQPGPDPSPERDLEIIGIIRSPHDDVFEPAAPRRFYRPLGQVGGANTYLHIQLDDPAAMAAMAGRLRAELHALDPDTPLLLLQPLADFVDKNINLLLILLAGVAFGVFGAVALILAVIGIYAVRAYSVARRTREIGIRMALGAQPAAVLLLILKQGAAQTAVGLALGLFLALGAGLALSKMLYHVSPFDPAALAAATTLLTLSALFAGYWPARRATRVDPTTALRSE